MLPGSNDQRPVAEPTGSTNPPGDPHAALAALWAERRPEVVADLESLRALLSDLRQTPDSAAQRARAVTLAHRIHGALGVFGHDEAKSRLALIEAALRAEPLTLEILDSTIGTVDAAVAVLP